MPRTTVRPGFARRGGWGWRVLGHPQPRCRVCTSGPEPRGAVPSPASREARLFLPISKPVNWAPEKINDLPQFTQPVMESCDLAPASPASQTFPVLFLFSFFSFLKSTASLSLLRLPCSDLLKQPPGCTHKTQRDAAPLTSPQGELSRQHRPARPPALQGQKGRGEPGRGPAARESSRPRGAAHYSVCLPSPHPAWPRILEGAGA